MELKNFDTYIKEDKSKAIYLGAFLDQGNMEKLLKRFPLAYENKWADHVTLMFGKLDKYKSLGYKLGETITIEIDGYVDTEGVQAVRVKNINSTNSIPHITLSTDKGVKPFKSNSVLNHSRNIKPVTFKVKGRVGFWFTDGKISYNE